MNNFNHHHHHHQRGGGGGPPTTQRQQQQQQPLVQKLAGAIQNLRRDRDREYRAKVEAEERLRLAQEEQEALAKIVADLRAKHAKIVQAKQTVQASLGPLERQVHELAEKTQFQHNELLGARAKIQQTTQQMETTAREREANLKAIRQLAHERRLKVNAMDEHQPQNVDKQVQVLLQRAVVDKAKNNKTVADDQDQEAALELKRQKEGLERELNCLMFEWDSFPRLMEEKGRIYLAQAKRMAEINDAMEAELGRRGINLTQDEHDMTLLLNNGDHAGELSSMKA